jgi:hypothetical protein
MSNITDMRERRLRQRAEALGMELVSAGRSFVLRQYNDPPYQGDLLGLEAVIAEKEAESR